MGYHFSSRLTATLDVCMIYFKITWALAILLEHMHKKFEINWTKIKGGYQSGRKVVTHDSKSDLPLRISQICSFIFQLNQPGGSLWFRISREMFICANLLFVTNHPQRANQIINLQCLEFVEVWLLQTEARAEDLCHIRGASINYVDKLFFFLFFFSLTI